MTIAAIIVGGLYLWLIIDKVCGIRKWNKIRKTCKHEDWIYFRRCKTCDRLEVLDPATGEYRFPDFQEESKALRP